MANLTLQGQFTSTGEDQVIFIQPGASWIEVYNMANVTATATTKLATKFTWSTEMINGSKMVEFKSDAAHADNLIQVYLTDGFYPYNGSVTTPGTLHTDITGISNAATPVVTTTGAHGLSTGDTVILYDVTNGQQLGGIPFDVEVLTANTFSLVYMAQIAAATTGSFRLIDRTSYFFPMVRYITKATNSVNAHFTLSMISGLEIGQQIRVSIPSIFGMTLASTAGTITAIDNVTNTITTNIDTSSLDAFVFPTSAAVASGFTPAQVVPFGENTAKARETLNPELEDAVRNIAGIGIRLKGGANCPAGEAGDVIMYKVSNYTENS